MQLRWLCIVPLGSVRSTVRGEKYPTVQRELDHLEIPYYIVDRYSREKKGCEPKSWCGAAHVHISYLSQPLDASAHVQYSYTLGGLHTLS